MQSLKQIYTILKGFNLILHSAVDTLLVCNNLIIFSYWNIVYFVFEFLKMYGSKSINNSFCAPLNYSKHKFVHILINDKQRLFAVIPCKILKLSSN